MGKNKTGRNASCPCESGLKYKKCHGDNVKIELSKLAYIEKFDELIETEKLKAEIKRGEQNENNKTAPK